MKWSCRRIRFVVTLNEAWRGEVSHCLLTDASGKVRAVQDQGSFIPQLERPGHVAAGYGISDFPLNNKSYNLSYCGFDL
jgi:Ni,Fe-hydrogenase III large subunit